MEDKKEDSEIEIRQDQEIQEAEEQTENKLPLVDLKFKERRKEERKVLSPARLVRTLIYYDEDLVVEKWVSVVDISRHGMKIIIDIPLKLADSVKIQFYTSKDPVETEGRIAWCKELIKGSGLYAAGLDLAKLSQENFETINNFLMNFAPFEERKAVRVKKPFLVELKTQNEVKKFYTYAVDLSITGMRIINDFELPTEEIILIKAILAGNETGYIKAKVVWQETKSFGVVIGINFIEAEKEDIEKIKEFIYSS
ncbi:MAG: PilZ domain-containing protein [Candidatus Calescibacterium sp.]|nr:PilZ domain-containing protein [Candidatus Calescibacterium sp.]MCX7971811.1 PilZ domain-containing protein [bacterium]MDW8194925.1 PilZ domain-containing protein [Candidatus Calescibacterium sp.]